MIPRKATAGLLFGTLPWFILKVYLFRFEVISFQQHKEQIDSKQRCRPERSRSIFTLMNR